MEYHPLTAKQKGGIGEALLTAHTTRATDLVVEWIRQDLRARVASKLGEIEVSHDPRVETYYVNYEGRHMSWTPDCLFIASSAYAYGDLRSSDDLRVDYPIEIKAGQYAELERNQREVMELLGTDTQVVPVVAEIDLSPLPDEFGISMSTLDPGPDHQE